MTKDQSPSDKACDAYFDNPYAATSGSYHSDRVIFYAGFAAGAASRDAEVVSLTNQRDYEYVRAENAEQERDQFEQERDQLSEQVKMLRYEVIRCRDWFETQAKVTSKGGPSSWELMLLLDERDAADEALAATEPR